METSSKALWTEEPDMGSTQPSLRIKHKGPCLKQGIFFLLRKNLKFTNPVKVLMDQAEIGQPSS